MKSGRLVVCVYAAGPASPAAGRLLAHPVLGRPAAFFALDAAAGLRPDALVCAGLGRLVPESLIIDGARAVGRPVYYHEPEKGRSPENGENAAVAAARLAAGFLRKYPASDVVVMPLEMPLLGVPTLRSVVGLHRRRNCSLTIMTLGGKIPEAPVFVFRKGVPLSVFCRSNGKGTLELCSERVTASGGKVGLFEAPAGEELLVLSSLRRLAAITQVLRWRKNESAAASGAFLLDPGTVWIDWETTIGPGTVIYPFVFLEGRNRIGRDSRIHPYVHLKDSRIGDGVTVHSSTVMDSAVLEDGTAAGPFTRLRPGTRIRSGAKVGNFVEMKNTDFGRRSKAMHLSYLGDSKVGENVNVGAGTITCNYDGFSKNQTLIGRGAFIGSGTELVAPVKVGRGAYVAAGSTITQDVGPGALAIARARQVEKPGWALERLKRAKARRAARK
jgi:bifunctional UDP-N-acetylglucosamine pyrophosphorylase/glucosamine-1-phosphate N-acetyltransferase